MQMKAVNINSALADNAAKRFAADHGLAVDDPIVITLRTGLRRALGNQAFRNRLKAQRDAMQPSLFPSAAKPVLAIHGSASVSTPEQGTDSRP
jgi:hypothetical protein